MTQKAFNKEDIDDILNIMEEMYPEAECELHFGSVFQLLISVVLSAQTTDKSVNAVTGELFRQYPDAFAMADAGTRAAHEAGLSPEALSDEELLDIGAAAIAQIIRRIGMYKTKSRNVLKLSSILAREYNGIVPEDYEKLTALPGVGRKTANVVLSVGFGHQRIAVDTHVFRVANRIGLVNEKDVLKTELALMEALPEERWSRAHHSLIFHGRYCCDARKPKCEECLIKGYCAYYGKK